MVYFLLVDDRYRIVHTKDYKTLEELLSDWKHWSNIKDSDGQPAYIVHAYLELDLSILAT